MARLRGVLPGVGEKTIQRDIEDFGLWFFPAWRRSVRLVFSTTVTLLCIGVAIVVSVQLFYAEEYFEGTFSIQTVYLLKGATEGVLIPIMARQVGFRTRITTWSPCQVAGPDFVPALPHGLLVKVQALISCQDHHMVSLSRRRP